MYGYTYFSKNLLWHPINWLFVKIQLQGMMKKALIGIKAQAESNNDFIIPSEIPNQIHNIKLI